MLRDANRIVLGESLQINIVVFLDQSKVKGPKSLSKHNPLVCGDLDPFLAD